MKQGYTYTVIFMFVMSALFTAALAIANAFYLPAIKSNEVLAEKKSILDALDIDVPADSNQVNNIFDKSIRKSSFSGKDVYENIDETGNVTGYALPFSGPGLWGTIIGYGGVSGDFSTLLGINFTVQSETPGLGGRIDEAWYKEQFRGISIKQDGKLEFDPEKSGIDGITGASITSKSVTNIIKKLVEENVSGLEAVK